MVRLVANTRTQLEYAWCSLPNRAQEKPEVHLSLDSHVCLGVRHKDGAKNPGNEAGIFEWTRVGALWAAKPSYSISGV